MLKKLLVSILSASLLMGVVACGTQNSTASKNKTGSGNGNDSNQSATTGDAQKPIILKLGHANSATDPWQLGALKFASLVKQKTNGSVIVQVYPNSELGTDTQLIEGMESGNIDSGLVAGVLSNFYAPIGILTLPYLFKSMTQEKQVLYGPIGQSIQKQLLSHTGIRGLDFWLRGPRELTSNNKITNLQQLKGLKIRVPEIPADLSAWRAFGAAPTPMSFDQVYMALKTGTIDAQENPLAVIESHQLYQVQKYLMMTNHEYSYVLLGISDKAWKKLSPTQQNAVQKAADEATTYENNMVDTQDTSLLTQLKKQGMTVVNLDTAPFIEAVKTVQQQYGKKYGEALYQSILKTN